MKITNKYGLPEALVNAVKNDPYNAGHGDYSATSLLKPPRQLALQKKHKDEISEDASDRIWSLIGQTAHVICERGNASDIVEKRFYGYFGNYTVSAQIDNLGMKDRMLSDYKVSTLYKFRPNNPPDPDWVAQLNIQCEILRQNKEEIKGLQIIGILRDWSKIKSRTEENYPRSNVVVLSIPIWESDKTKAFVLDRIKLHEDAKLILPECSKEERWASEDTYAVKKKTAKRAIKLFKDYQSAKDMAEPLKDHFVEFRQGESKRCLDYCSVAQFCTQAHKMGEDDLVGALSF